MSYSRLAPLVVLLFITPAVAQQNAPRELKEAVGFTLGLISATLIPLWTFLTGLGVHFLLRAVAPRRMRRVTHDVGRGPWRSLAFGVLDTAILFLVFAVAAGSNLGAIVILVLVVYALLAAVGLHGISRNLGERILGERVGGPEAARSELWDLALGWFVLCFVGAIPFVGWAWFLVNVVRGVGAAVLLLFASDDDEG